MKQCWRKLRLNRTSLSNRTTSQKGFYMMIQKVDVFPLAYTEPNDDDSTRHVVLVRIQSSEGEVGWGECVTIFRESTYATAALLKYGLTDLLIGRDPLEIRALWEML